MSDNDLQLLVEALDQLPEFIEPLGASAIDGFLVGVLMQPRPVAQADWWPYIVHPDEGPGARLPRLNAQQAAALDQVQAVVSRRRDELNQAIMARRWFDPWVFEENTEDEDEASANVNEAPHDADDPITTAVQPWCAGFALALDTFEDWTDHESEQTTEALALIYAYFDADDLEDADELLEAIAELEPVESLEQAVEDLVTGAFLLADQTRPLLSPNVTASRRGGGQGGARGESRGGPRAGARSGTRRR